MNTVIIFLAILCLGVSESKIKDRAVRHTELLPSFKRADGLMRDLVNLLNEEKDERKVIRSEMQTNKDLMKIMKKKIEDVKKKTTRNNNRINKVVNQIQTTENGVKNIVQDTSNKFVDVWRDINKLKALIGTKMYNGVGFTARLGVSKTYRKGEILIFKDVITNYGNGYNKNSGKFTCKTPGLYIFHLHVLSEYKHTAVWLIKNGNQLVRTFSSNLDGPGSYDMGSASMVIKLKVGDIVWAAPDKHHYPSIDHLTYIGGAMFHHKGSCFVCLGMFITSLPKLLNNNMTHVYNYCYLSF